jgi:hypothetical protein
MQQKLIVVLAVTGCIAASPAFAGLFDNIVGSQLNAISSAVGEVRKQAPQNEQLAIGNILSDLRAVPDDQLYTLNDNDTACARPKVLDCHGLPGARVKPFVQLELEHRKAQEAKSNSQNNFYVAAGGLVTSALSLGLSIFVAVGKEPRKKRR